MRQGVESEIDNGLLNTIGRCLITVAPNLTVDQKENIRLEDKVFGILQFNQYSESRDMFCCIEVCSILIPQFIAFNPAGIDLLESTPVTSPSRALVERALEAATRIANKCDHAQDNTAFFHA